MELGRVGARSSQGFDNPVYDTPLPFEDSFIVTYDASDDQVTVSSSLYTSFQKSHNMCTAHRAHTTHRAHTPHTAHAMQFIFTQSILCDLKLQQFTTCHYLVNKLMYFIHQFCVMGIHLLNM